MGIDSRIAIPTSSPDPATATPPGFKRRRFLLALGAGSAAVATTAANAAPLVAQADAVAPQPADTASAYRVTDHVRDYYRSTKI
jgi:hypothetical protein